VSSKEWLAAIGALSVSLNTSAEAQQAADGRAGVAAAVNTTTTGVLSGATRTLFVGNDVFKEERITTDANGRAQLLFLDQSAVSVGPNAELVIDRFVYDEKSRVGTLAVQASRGLLRFVGGDISKQQDVVVRTPTMLIGIRGGISLINIDQNGATQAIFMFGAQLTATLNQTGQSFVITRPGFGVSSGGPGQPFTPPTRVSGATISGFLGQLEAAPPPTGIIPGAGPGLGNLPLPSQVAPDRTLQDLRRFTDVRDLNQLLRQVTVGSTQQRQRAVITGHS
jgi:hypothetical protein